MKALMGLIAGNMATVSMATETSPELAVLTVLTCAVALMMWPMADWIEAMIG